MSEKGLVSIVIPNRNHAHYLPRALDAMLVQTWRKLEIVVVDDASTDNSHDVVVAYTARDSRIRLLPLSEHSGVNGAVLAALPTLRGEFIHVAGADDFVEPNFLERCLEEMKKHPGVGLSFSDPTEFREREGRKILFPLYLSKQSIYFSPTTLAALMKVNYFHISPNTGIFRLDAFREAGGYQVQLHWLSDWFVTLVIGLRYGACYLPEQLTYVTMRDDSYSARNTRRINAQRPLLDEVLNLLARPEYADVANTMRDAALMPAYHFHLLLWLMQNPKGVRFLTPRLVARVFMRSAWSLLRSRVPVKGRRFMRRFQNALRRSA